MGLLMMKAVPEPHAVFNVKPGSTVTRAVFSPAGSLTILLSALALLVSGCATRKDLLEGHYLTKEQAYGRVVLEIGGIPTGFFLLRVDQLPELRAADLLGYLGSDSTFHFMRAWVKHARRDEIVFFALDMDDCDVEEPLSILPWTDPPRLSFSDLWREIDRTPTALPVILEDGHCRVAAWSKPGE